ncbi:MAG: glutathione peroxidase [Candidatus Melainabacteria bacterium HGW-Melainabacteria-1]|nr:MAG: glutathione peroxidase [Candidatus Melainabacteria bacterium HGW-Melainabacteria-1]
MIAAGLLLGATQARSAEPACPPLLKHTLAGIDGKDRPLCQYKGKVLLVVNTASLCGYTPQYRDLQPLHSRFQARGFSVLGFPANNFNRQEPGSNSDIAKFCQSNYQISFPMFAKSAVLGKQANPLFQQLTQATGQAPLWNFHKYLIGRDGKQVVSFGSGVSPLDPKLIAKLEQLLK